MESGVGVSGTVQQVQHDMSTLALQSLDMSAIQRWIRCLCIVNFDLLVGQTLEQCVPAHALTAEEAQNVANLAFPDSNSGVFGDASFVFRFRSQSAARDSYPFYFGWVYFRQKKDASISRGYFQKSVVLITHLPINMEAIVNLIGPMYFDCGPSVLEAALHAMSGWPTPAPSFNQGTTELPCLGHVFNVHIDAIALASIDDPASPSALLQLARSSAYSYTSTAVERDPALRLSISTATPPASTPPAAESTDDDDYKLAAAAAAAASVVGAARKSSRHSASASVGRGAPLSGTPTHSSQSSSGGFFSSIASSIFSLPQTLGLVTQDSTPIRAGSMSRPSAAFNTPSSPLHLAVTTDTSVSSPAADAAVSLSALLDTTSARAPGCFNEINLYGAFGDMLSSLWFLWELVITGQPVMLYAKSPAVCSRAVLAMCSLISPLIYRGDYRPFFTIADADFRHFQQLHDHASLNTALIIGVTNPFFLKAFDNVAHIVHVPFGTACCVHVSSTLPDDETDSAEAPTTPMQRHSSVFSAAAALQSPSRGSASASTPLRVTPAMRDRSQRQAAIVELNATADPSNSLDSLAEGAILTRSRPLLLPNAAILGQLMDAGSRESLASYESLTSINNSILRRHFFELTAEFLLPLRKYYTPRERNSEKSNPYLHPPEIPAFKEAIFLGEVGDVVLKPTVAASSEQPYHYPLLHACGLKSATLGTLYAKFVRSPHFYPWLNSKRELAQLVLDRVIVSRLRSTDVKALLNHMPVRQAVAMLDAVQAHLTRAASFVSDDQLPNNPGYDAALIAILQTHRTLIHNALPDSIRQSLAVSRTQSFSGTSSPADIATAVSSPPSAQPAAPRRPQPSPTSLFDLNMVDNYY